MALEEYEDSAVGLVQSFAKRFPDSQVDDILVSLAEKDAPHFVEVAQNGTQ